jgi:hypothetical protein
VKLAGEAMEMTGWASDLVSKVRKSSWWMKEANYHRMLSLE